MHEHGPRPCPLLRVPDPVFEVILHATTIPSLGPHTMGHMRKLLLAGLVLAVACSRGEPTTGVTVSRVIDGDTIVADADTTVRLIGINAPERDECYGAESGDALRGLVHGHAVSLGFDTERYDSYGRLLAYVYADGTFVNLALVAEGLAVAGAYPPNTLHQGELDRAMADAEAQHAGMWDPAACGTARAAVAIGQVAFDPPGPDGDSLNEETVTISSESTVDLTGWVLRDGSSSHRYRFPDGFVLAGGSRVTVHTGCGADTSHDLFWCEQGPVWDNDGDTVIVYDESGALAGFITYAPP
jgi:micrococcal nuclease